VNQTDYPEQEFSALAGEFSSTNGENNARVRANKFICIKAMFMLYSWR